MSQIHVSDLTFGYEGSYDYIFEKVSFSIDTNWKLGFIGRNGKGKTTFLRLLRGAYEYEGVISASTAFDYFPYVLTEAQKRQSWGDILEEICPDCELWRVICELEKLGIGAVALYRPIETLSHGERTKVMLAILFSRDNYFLLVDEPTNHLDRESREIVKRYLQQKKGFILVSHDRDLLDACIDHVLAFNRSSIEVQSGNFSTWLENKERTDAFRLSENEKHRREIAKLNQAARRASGWADANERTKIGIDPIKDHDRGIGTRPYIGAKTKKMQSRVKQMEKRIAQEIVQKEGLLEDIETPAELKLMPLQHHKEVLIRASDYGLAYGDHQVLKDFRFELRRGERVFLQGENGCGKSSFIKAVLECAGSRETELPSGASDVLQGETRFGKPREMRFPAEREGSLATASGLIVSYINQDTSFLRGSLDHFCERRGLEERLLKAVLRQLDMERVQFAKPMEDYSEGQKKKVLIAASLVQQAHLYIWDEPLNYIDVFSRMQIEHLILRFRPTMLVVDHDVRFREKIATRVVTIERLPFSSGYCP